MLKINLMNILQSYLVQKISFNWKASVIIGKILIWKRKLWIFIKAGNTFLHYKKAQPAIFRSKAKNFCNNLNSSLLNTIESAHAVAAYVHDAEKFPYPFSLRQFWVIQVGLSNIWWYRNTKIIPMCYTYDKAQNFRLMDTLMEIGLNIHGQAVRQSIWAIATIRYSLQ